MEKERSNTMKSKQTHERQIAYRGDPEQYAAGKQLGTLIPVSKRAHRELIAIAGTQQETLVITLNPSATECHVCLVIEPDTKATIALQFPKKQQRCDMECFVGHNASVTVHSTLDNAEHRHLTQCVLVEEEATLRWYNNTNGNDVHHDYTCALNGRGAQSTLQWRFHATGTQKQHITAKHVFAALECKGNIMLRGVAEEKTDVYVRGMADIRKDAHGANARVTEHVLILDSTAKVDALPALQIATDDVQASHSATISNIHAEDLFYCETRGMAKKQARAMIAHEFLGTSMPNDMIHAMLPVPIDGT